MSDSVNDYIIRLEQQLRLRGIVDPRTLAEAREHLVDAVEDGRTRGLSTEDAEHEACERFGAPEIVAAHILEERERMKTGVAGAFATIWQRKWWILVPTVIAAVTTSVASDFQPVRYKSATTILVVPQRVPGSDDRASVMTLIEDRLRSMNQQIKSRTRLEQIIEEFNLYPERRKKDLMQDIVEDMSKAIDVDVIQGDVLRVAFTADNPRTAQQVAERLAASILDESLRDRDVVVEGTAAFLDAEVEEARRQIIEYEDILNKAGTRHGGAVSQADVIPYEILKENYKALLLKRADARVAASLERRQIGEQFRVLDPARLPEQPVAQSRVRAAVMGALVGLTIGLVLVAFRRTPNTRPPALAQA